jgi:hypothetical protein
MRRGWLLLLGCLSGCWRLFTPLVPAACDEETFPTSCVPGTNFEVGLICIDGFVLELRFCGNATDLSGLDLSGYDLTPLFLQDALLVGTDLSAANLFGVTLTAADLRAAKVTGAVLVLTDLRFADLTGADLTGANLTNADLSSVGAFLDSFTDLSDADLNGAILVNTNLEGVIGAPRNAQLSVYGNTICPDGANSDDVGGTCVGHGF